MEILTTEEIKQKTENFLSKYSKELECKMYGFEEIVHREGERSRKIYIVKNGVFRIGRVNAPIPDITLGFCFKSSFIPSIASIIPDFPSLLQIKSISNNIANCNSLYEIGIEQWEYFTEKDKTLENFHASVLYDNFANLINITIYKRQNRKTEKLFSEMYDAKSPILNSGIEEKYLAAFFGVTIDSLRRMFTNRILTLNKKGS